MSDIGFDILIPPTSRLARLFRLPEVHTYLRLRVEEPWFLCAISHGFAPGGTLMSQYPRNAKRAATIGELVL
jgi:hypothetical protein